MQKNFTLGFIGAGNMATALAKGILKNDLLSSCNLYMCDKNSDKLDYWQNLGAKTSLDIIEVFLHADIIFLAIKPQALRQLFSQIKNADAIKKRLAFKANKPIIVSILAGVNLQTLEEFFIDFPLIRVMPNLPATLGLGVCGACLNNRVDIETKQTITQLLEASGICIWVDEDKIDVITAISGSGPAYFFYIFEIIQNIAKQYGFSDELAKTLVLQTALGAVEQAMQSEYSLPELKERVTSKGGTTFAALEVFKDNNLKDILDKGIKAAFNRARELGALKI